jgi:hypothetical protein
MGAMTLALVVWIIIWDRGVEAFVVVTAADSC